MGLFRKKDDSQTGFGKWLWNQEAAKGENRASYIGGRILPVAGSLIGGYFDKKRNLFEEMQAAPDKNYERSLADILSGKQEQLDRFNPLFADLQQKQSAAQTQYDTSRATSYQDTAEAQGVLTRANQANQDEMNIVENSAMQTNMTPEAKLAWKASIKSNYDNLLSGLASKDTAYQESNRSEFNNLSNLYFANRANLTGAQNAVTSGSLANVLGAQNIQNQGNLGYLDARLEGYSNFERNLFDLFGKGLDFAGSAIGAGARAVV